MVSRDLLEDPGRDGASAGELPIAPICTWRMLEADDGAEFSSDYHVIEHGPMLSSARDVIGHMPCYAVRTYSTS